MSKQFPSASLARRLGVGSLQLVNELKLPHAPENSPVDVYLTFLLDRFQERWIAKHKDILPTDGESAI